MQRVSTIWEQDLLLGPSNNAVITRDCEPARIAGDFRGDLTVTQLRCVRLASRSGARQTVATSCDGHPFECHEATDVVDEVLQADLCSRSDDSDRPHDPAAR